MPGEEPAADNHPCRAFMLEAIRLSRNGFGRTAPNPCVGAVLVRDGNILARGWHEACGERHAERAALDDAAQKGLDPSGCTLVVTLEPCAHYGRTPPCTEAILEAGIRHVVIGARERHTPAAGGAEILRRAGLLVECGIAARECLDNIADFLLFQHGSRPYVLLKLASTLDGRIAARNGAEQRFSSPETLEYVHWLRGRVQAVLVGGNTFYADNPRLTARPGGVPGESQPLAVVVTTRLPVKTFSFCLLRERPGGTIFLTSLEASRSRAALDLRSGGVAVHGLEAEAGGLCLEQGLEILRREYGCFYVLCEGGGKLGLSLLQKRLADELLLHLSPRILGDNQAKPVFDGREPQHMDAALRLRLISGETRGGDLCLRFMPE
ncbi:MAG: bifunctional diaminohydroxyphosphoribosylaminopyrimidine deaminase/5-amino-6-(5-phosphoribosylamino)uracil reductase RibD [Deltaproteobacteria bacterium]|jgi:diaminohydroxyphosphoribosylaminopyrimidine deaminase/5-amino-6-(5-phosphoribosylamino)uracil reductase|nr:bifunctional diaminohydroxyphosphoribosylaminopyrimidine deaminase/5-amino-6-(5-phosphoribosylamino)uracil reductase RibD [Deltaproteobacteria bacterium]